MEAITARPKNKKQVALIESFFNDLKAPFEKTKDKSPYNPEFVQKILQGDNDLKEGKGRKVTIEELNNLWK